MERLQEGNQVSELRAMKLMLASVRVVLFFAADCVEITFNLECSSGLYCLLHDKAVYYTDTGECRGHKKQLHSRQDDVS